MSKFVGTCPECKRKIHELDDWNWMDTAEGDRVKFCRSCGDKIESVLEDGICYLDDADISDKEILEEGYLNPRELELIIKYAKIRQISDKDKRIKRAKILLQKSHISPKK